MAIYCLAVSPDNVTIKLFQNLKSILRPRLKIHYGSVNSLVNLAVFDSQELFHNENKYQPY